MNNLDQRLKPRCEGKAAVSGRSDMLNCAPKKTSDAPVFADYGASG